MEDFMKKSKKLFTAFSLITLALTSCGNGSNSNSSLPSSLDDGDIVRDEQGNIVYNNVDLTMWSVTTGDDAKTQDDIIAGFNDMYSGMISVETRHISRYDLETLLQSTMEFDRSNAPDILFTHGARAAEYEDRGWLQPLNPYYEKANLVLDFDDFSTSLIDATTVDNYVYGLPIDVHSAILEIRSDILEKNNLPIPTNFSELISVSLSAIELASQGNLWIRGENPNNIPAETWRKASSQSQYYPFPFSYGDMWVHEFLGYTVAAQNGGKIVDENGLPAWDDEGTITGLTMLKNLLFPSETGANNYALSKAYGSDYDVGDAPFRNGEAIFKLNGPWVYENDMTTFDRDLKNDGGSVNITTRNLGNLFAIDPNNDNAGLIKGEGHAIMLLEQVSSMTKKTAAMVFADYMANYSGIEWAKRGHIPALQSVATSSEYTADPAYEQYIKYWGTSTDYIVVPATKNYSYIDSYFKQGLQQVLSSQFVDTSVDSIIDSMYQDCVDYIQLYS
jgi:ABC-type glycerol-3-phosphate transport system substrate-binding protein